MNKKNFEKTSLYHDNSGQTSGVPSCLWMLLGGGVILILTAVGLLLAFVPLEKQGNAQMVPVEESPTGAEITLPTASATPDVTLTPTAHLAGTPTLTLFEQAATQPLEIGDLLSITATAEEGLISFSPYIFADAGNFILRTGEQVTLVWEDFPAGARQYHFFLKSTDYDASLNLGMDNDPADGVEIVWQVPANITGELYGIAIYQDGYTVATFVSSTVYSRDPE